MRFLLPVVGAAALGLPAPALGQAMTTPMAMPGTCSGSILGKMFSGKVYLLVGERLVTPTTGGVGGLFGRAECQCHPSGDQAIKMRIILDAGQAAPVGTPQGIQMFVGAPDCENVTSRTTNVCEDVTNLVKLTYAPFQNTLPIDIPVPADVLSAPIKSGQTRQFCEDVGNTQNSITIAFGPATMPTATCKLSLPVQNTPPPAAQNVGVQSGNGALTVSWDTMVNSGIERYQVLCAPALLNGDGTPQYPEGQYLYYSVCLNNQMHRRISIPGGGTANPTPTVDGGTTRTMSVAPPLSKRRQSPPARPDVVDMSMPDDAGTGMPDMGAAGADLAAGADHGAGPDLNTTLMGPPDFEALDPKYLCSDQVRPAGTNVSARLSGLENGRTYYVKVVAIDYFGNPTGSATVSGVPQPTRNLLEALHDSGNSAAGFGCQAGRGPRTAPGMLALLALLGLRRRLARGGKAC